MSEKLITNLEDTLTFHEIRLQLAPLAIDTPYELQFKIADYSDKIVQYYSENIKGDIALLCKNAEIEHHLAFKNFGLELIFKEPCELNLHDVDMQLKTALKPLIDQFGVLAFKNAYLSADIIDMCHKNNFPHLNFHRDRNDHQANNYSLYTRNPFDELQQEPRKASTLFVDNAVGYLQAYCEGITKIGEKGRRGHYAIFGDKDKHIHKDISYLFGNIILEQRWDAPVGTGEVCIINNQTVLHSSYKHGFDKGYRIGARYLS